MKNVQIKGYATFDQVEVDLRHLETSSAWCRKTLLLIEGKSIKENAGKIRTTAKAVESVSAALKNIEIWVRNANVDKIVNGKASDLESKISRLTSQANVLNKSCEQFLQKTASPSKNLLTFASRLKLYSDSLLFSKYDNSSASSRIIIPRSKESPFSAVQITYSNVKDVKNFNYPKFFISVAEINNKSCVGTSYVPSFFKTGSYHEVKNAGDAENCVKQSLIISKIIG